MGYLRNGDKTLCFGCRACEETCPKKCISMIEDDEKFLYPFIDEKLCVNCKKCDEVCPLNYTEVLLPEKNTALSYVAVHKNDNVIHKSSSGGAFSAIVECAYDENTIIFGATFNELKVIHDFAENLEDAKKFRKSKYIQSNTNGCFTKVKKFLNEGKNVVGYEFRNKKMIKGKYNSRSAEIKYDDSSSDLIGISDDPFLYAYYTRLNYRPACASCKYANILRVSDITLGDAWGIEKLYSELDALKGVSLILFNSEKGKGLIDKVKDKVELFSVDLKWAELSNEQLHKPTDFHKKRDKFFKYIKHGKTFYKSVRVVKPSLFKIILFKIYTYVKKVVSYYVQR